MSKISDILIEITCMLEEHIPHEEIVNSIAHRLGGDKDIARNWIANVENQLRNP